MAKIILLSCLLFLSSSFFVFAQTQQLDYPGFPGVPPPTGQLTDFLRYLYQISLGLGAILAFGFFSYGGILYLISFGNPSRMDKAKELIFSALLGLFILFASYTILSTIDPALVIWDIRIFNFDLPLLQPPATSLPDAPPGCQEIPVQKTFEAMHDQEKEAIEIVARIEPLIFGNDVLGVMPAIEELWTLMKQCTCSKPQFKAECLADSTSWQCPALCLPSNTDPCPPALKTWAVPQLERELTRASEVIALLESYGFADELSENDDELREKIIEMIYDGLAEGIEAFLNFLETELGPLSNNDAEREQRLEEIKDLLERSLSVQLTALEKKLRKLTELRMDFDSHLADVSQCRSETRQGTANLWTCLEAQTRYSFKECKELDFYCCP